MAFLHKLVLVLLFVSLLQLLQSALAEEAIKPKILPNMKLTVKCLKESRKQGCDRFMECCHAQCPGYAHKCFVEEDRVINNSTCTCLDSPDIDDPTSFTTKVLIVLSAFAFIALLLTARYCCAKKIIEAVNVKKVKKADKKFGNV